MTIAKHIIPKSYKEGEKYIRLIYISINHYTREETQMDYKIELVTVPSNLGKGEVLYMMCPSRYDIRCRKLYLAYRSQKWYSRKDYAMRGIPVYYPCQSRSKNDYIYNRKHHFKQLLEDLRSKPNFHPYHKGEKTKALIRYEAIEREYNKYLKKTNGLQVLSRARSCIGKSDLRFTQEYLLLTPLNLPLTQNHIIGSKVCITC